MTTFDGFRARAWCGTLLVLLLALCFPDSGAAQAAGDGPAPDATGRQQAFAGLRPDDLHRLRSVGRVAITSDGGRIAYSVTDRSSEGHPASTLWILDSASGERNQVAETGGELAWSPNGARLAFFGTRNGKRGIWLTGGGGESVEFLAATQWTNRPLPSTGSRLAWSPDGRRLAFVSAERPASSDTLGTDPRVITRYAYKPTASTGDTRFADYRRAHLFVVDVSTGEVTQLTEGQSDEHSIDWSPDGSEIVFVSNRATPSERLFNYDLFAIDVETGRIRRLTSTESVEYRPVWSPDGSALAYEGTRRGLTSSETTMEDTHVWTMRADGTDRREIGAVIDNRQGEPAWSVDGQYVYFSVDEGGSTHLYRVSLEGGKAERVIGGRGEVGSWSLTSDGQLLYTFSGPESLDNLFLRSNSGSIRQLTELNAELIDRRAVAPVRSFQFQSFDGTEVEAFLTEPLRRGENSRHPLIVMIKGGPHSQQGPGFNFKAQTYASRGWAVLMVNYRGSIGYGQDFADAIFRDQNGGEALDVLYGARAAIQRYEWIDGTRVGIEGGSYGGQLTNWLITQTDLFSAAIPIAGISNLVSFNYMAYYHDYLAVEYGGWPHQGEIMERLWERSPLRFVAQVSTPVMLVHGENDNDVPIAEAEQYYIALKDVGVETVMVRYPREGHGLRETGHRVDLIERSVGWYEDHFD